MTASLAVSRGRRAAEARMTSRVSIMRKTGDTTTDGNGYEIPEWAAVYVDLPFRLSSVASGERGSVRHVSVGGVEFDQAMAVGNFPSSTTDLANDDHIDVTSGEWSGSTLRIVEATKADQKTARRVPIEEVPRPGEWS